MPHDEHDEWQTDRQTHQGAEHARSLHEKKVKAEAEANLPPPPEPKKKKRKTPEDDGGEHIWRGEY
jgi:hypothetical protein